MPMPLCIDRPWYAATPTPAPTVEIPYLAGAKGLRVLRQYTATAHQEDGQKIVRAFSHDGGRQIKALLHFRIADQQQFESPTHLQTALPYLLS